MTLTISIRHVSPRKAILDHGRLTAALALPCSWRQLGSAQVQNGNINGTVKDQQGGVLPGVTATLHGFDATRSAGDRRRPASSAFSSSHPGPTR